MSELEVNDLKEKIEEALSDFRNGISQIEDIFDRYSRILGTTPCKELNELISFGFVPNANFVLDDKITLTFLGYTECLGMQFKNKAGDIISSPLCATFKNMARFKKEEQ